VVLICTVIIQVLPKKDQVMENVYLAKSQGHLITNFLIAWSITVGLKTKINKHCRHPTVNLYVMVLEKVTKHIQLLTKHIQPLMSSLSVSINCQKDNLKMLRKQMKRTKMKLHRQHKNQYKKTYYHNSQIKMNNLK